MTLFCMSQDMMMIKFSEKQNKINLPGDQLAHHLGHLNDNEKINNISINIKDH